MHKTEDLFHIFNRCFASTHNTILVRGEDEPLYSPAREDQVFNRIIFAHDFFASGLHEIAHWLIAGAQRRTLEDYGYWYIPDGRNEAQQGQFEQMEVKPQAIEWILSVAADHPFRVSLDNLGGAPISPEQRARFRANILQQVYRYLEQGLASRVQTLVAALLDFYRPRHVISKDDFGSAISKRERVTDCSLSG